MWCGTTCKCSVIENEDLAIVFFGTTSTEGTGLGGTRERGGGQRHKPLNGGSRILIGLPCHVVRLLQRVTQHPNLETSK